MLKVGLTGGLASGKSFVGRAFRDLGCRLIQADELGHEVLEPGEEAYEATVREFGREILAEDGSIDRRMLAAIVFEDSARLEALNRIVHPAVYRRRARMLEEIQASDPGAIVILEVAILIETGGQAHCDKVVLVICEEEQQIERAMERGLTREEALARIRRQLPLEQKRQYADYVIDTSGAKEATRDQVRRVYDELRDIQA